MGKARTPVEAMVDAACGVTPKAEIPQRIKDYAAHVADVAVRFAAGFLGFSGEAGLELTVHASVDYALFHVEQEELLAKGGAS